MKFSKRKKNSIFDQYIEIKKVINIGFSVMKKDFIMMFLTKLVFALMPLLCIQMNIQMYSCIQRYICMEEVKVTIDVVCLVVAYVGSVLFCRLEVIVYERFCLQYGSLLTFEKKIKAMIHKKCAEIAVENFDKPDINKYAYEARVASINIYRIIQVLIGFLAMCLGIVCISGYFLVIDHIYIFMILLAIIPVPIEKAIEIVEKEKKQSAVLEHLRKAKALEEAILSPDYFMENIVLQNFDFLINECEKNQKDLNKIDKEVCGKCMLLELVASVISMFGKFGGYIIALIVLNRDGDFVKFTSTIIAFNAINNFMLRLTEEYEYLNMFVTMVRPFFNLFEIESKAEEECERLRGNIMLKDAGYCYTSEEVIKNIQLSIKEGERIVIVGENGSGKTTLARLLLGLYLPTSGDVMEDGVELAKVSDECKFANKTAVFQKICKYPLSIKENIAISDNRKSTDVNQINDLLYRVDLCSYDANKKIGKSIGEADLSGGEWRRLQIARGMYRTADFLLFDEPEDALDSLYEKQIYEYIKGATKEKTIVIISHRFGLNKYADKIVVMEQGEIVAVGKHEELLSRCKIYKKLWDAQAEVFS